MIRSAFWRAVEFWDVYLNPRWRPTAVSPADDRRRALQAFGDMVNGDQLAVRLGRLSPDDADDWCRALVEEHLCGWTSESRYDVYATLIELARGRRARRV